MKKTLSVGTVRLWLGLQALALVAGNVVGWSTIFREVRNFCTNQGNGLWSLTDFRGTITQNPLLTPCFWGSVVFVITLLWTVKLLISKNKTYVRAETRKIWWLLLGGTLFALANNVPIFYRYFTQPEGTAASCSGGVLTNPFATSCFLGFSAFFAAFIFSSILKYLYRKAS